MNRIGLTRLRNYPSQLEPTGVSQSSGVGEERTAGVRAQIGGPPPRRYRPADIWRTRLTATGENTTRTVRRAHTALGAHFGRVPALTVRVVYALRSAAGA